MFAGDDRCIHRSAQLSLGQVCKHQGKDTLQCPYHGWRYNDEGKCALIPACPDMPIPSKAKISKYDCAIRYGIVWVRLDNSFDCTEIPFLGDWDSEGMKVVVADSYVWETTAERRWENFTDFSHFAFVHPALYMTHSSPLIQQSMSIALAVRCASSLLHPKKCMRTCLRKHLWAISSTVVQCPIR